MNNGRIEQNGTFNELQNLGLDFMKLLKVIDAENKDASIEQSDIIQQRSLTYETNNDTNNFDDLPVEMHETIIKGRMASKVFFAYFKASKKPSMITLMIFVFILNQIISSGSDYFVAYWVNIESNSWFTTDNNTMKFLWNGPLSRDFTICIYSATIVMIVLLCQFQIIIYFSICMWSSINLHSAMFRSILRATMYFYNTNPVGRILNR